MEIRLVSMPIVGLRKRHHSLRLHSLKKELQTLPRLLPPPQQFRQALRIMRRKPEILPGVAFRILFQPLSISKIRLELSRSVARMKKPYRGIIEIPIGKGALIKKRCILGFSPFVGHLRERRIRPGHLLSPRHRGP